MTEISGRTRVYAIVADPVHHVQTPQRINALMRTRGHDGVMVPLHVSDSDLPAVATGLRGIRTLGGFIVTVPHKMAFLNLCDEVSARADQVGAVNCVRREADGRLVGDMLDGLGFVAGLRREGIEPKGRRVLMSGAGGAASAVAFALAEAGIAALSIANRTRAKSEELARRLSLAYPVMPVDIDGRSADAPDIVVNGTSLGLAGSDALPLDPASLTGREIVAEMVMDPPLTPLLAAAAAKGCRVHFGLPMLECQLELMANFMGATA
jgi:shikimate dehydrogenase